MAQSNEYITEFEQRLERALERFERRFEQTLARTMRRMTIRFFWFTLGTVATLHSILFVALLLTR